jgi:hypothetical protein
VAPGARTGAAILGILFLLAWASSAIADIPASRTFVGVFVQQVLGSAPRGHAAIALASIVILCALAGGLVAFCVGLFRGLPRR